VEIDKSGMGKTGCTYMAQSRWSLIPKEKYATSISQFHPISLLNVEGKIFFSINV